MREVKVFGPEERRDAINNLYCHYCGNTNQWQIDLGLRHVVECLDNGLAIEVDNKRTRKVLAAIEKNISRMLDRSISGNRTILHCANCGNAELDMHDNAIETCYNLGCPGCFHCGNWIEEDLLRELCEECIKQNSGDVDEEYCFTMCPHYDYGLEQVRQHYAITLTELIRDAGYGHDD